MSVPSHVRAAKTLGLLFSLLASGACASSARANAGAPAGCDKVDAQLAQEAAGAKEADLGGVSEQQPRMLNVRHVERRLADTVNGLPIDRVARPVILRYRITAQGRANTVGVARSSGSAEYAAAVAWAMGFAQFAPARLNGCPVAVWVEQDFTPRFPPRRRAPAPASGVQGPPSP